jgi:hypothetical protein
VLSTSPTIVTPTINTINSAAATNMTLNAGSSGATLVLGQGAGGIATLNRNLTASGGSITVSGGAYPIFYANGTTGGNFTIQKSGVSYGTFYGNDTNTVLDSAGSANLILQTGGATRATLTSTATTLTGNLTVSGTGTSSFATTTAFSVGVGNTQPTGGLLVGAYGTGGSLVVNTPSLSSVYGSGFAVDGTYTSGKSVIRLTGFGVQSGGPYSADLTFQTSNTGTISEGMRLTNTGNLLVGTTTDGGQKLQVISGDTYIARFTDGSTASVNIQKSAIVFANSAISAYAAGNYDASSHTFKIQTVTALTLTSAQQVQVNASTASSSTTTGALVVSGGVGVAGAIFAGGNLTVSGTGSINGGSGTAALTIKETASAATALLLTNRNSTQTWGIAVDAAAVDDKQLAFISGGNVVLSLNATTLAATLLGNLTVSGTGTSTFAGAGTFASTLSVTAPSTGGVQYAALAPTLPTSGQRVASFQGGTAADAGKGAVSVFAGENWVQGAATGTYTLIEATTNGSTTRLEAARFTPTATTVAGNLTVSGTGTSAFSGPVTISKAQAAAYTSLTIQNGDATGGSQLNMISGANTASINYAPGVFFKISIPSADSFQVSTNNITALTITSAQQVQVNATTASTTTSSGALVVGNGTSGGLGVGGSIYAGGDIITTKSNGVIKASGSSANAEVSAERLTTTPSSVSLVAAVSQPQLAFTSDTAASYTWGRILANSSEIVRVHSANLTAIANVAGAGIAVAGGIINTGSLTTGAPAGGTAAAWKLGTVASVSPTSPNRTIEVDIGGTIYYLHAKTTNN